ncbi:hypothetical protein T265_03043 [Opisthorchis viverrini]|uniref:Uncharacterized protein n=1 Tax=Opisthorchis viverrini TaxID=6198 RepID=A0A075AHV9_OPIVI|nr:hypothetical protein T265_03043 [Opisthorchis viverrini]KER30564.1 hypothetical protein T265_03043 [Opisthorchis viverrini]
MLGINCVLPTEAHSWCLLLRSLKVFSRFELKASASQLCAEWKRPSSGQCMTWKRSMKTVTNKLRRAFNQKPGGHHFEFLWKFARWSKWLECEFTRREARVAWQLGTKRVLQLNDCFREIHIADNLRQTRKNHTMLLHYSALAMYHLAPPHQFQPVHKRDWWGSRVRNVASAANRKLAW